jgi:flagellar hook-associated protein 3 FlgL
MSMDSAVLSLTQSNTGGIQAQLEHLDIAMDQILVFCSEAEAQLNGAQTARATGGALQEHTAAQRSSIEDVDVLSAYSDFTRLQQAFQAALQSAAQVIQPSLLDFLK